MDLRLNRRTAVVTAASRGIGLAVMRGLAAEGVDVTAGTLSPPMSLTSRSATRPAPAPRLCRAGPRTRWSPAGSDGRRGPPTCVLILADGRTANAGSTDITIDGGLTPSGSPGTQEKGQAYD
jgi:hypothetical protein